MRSNKATLNIRIRRIRNVILRRKHLVWRLTRGIERLNKELARNEQLQRVIASGAMRGLDKYARQEGIYG